MLIIFYIYTVDFTLVDLWPSSVDQIAVADSINHDLTQGANLQGHNASPKMAPVSCVAVTNISKIFLKTLKKRLLCVFIFITGSSFHYCHEVKMMK